MTMDFTQFDLDPRVLAGVRAAGFTQPTPIQEKALPDALAGRDVLGLAQTGTGKTAAFALPILQRLLDGPRGRVRALVVAPTRELAEQIHREFTMLGQGTKLRSATVYGGVGMNPQISALKGRADIIVACPGRLLDLLGRGHGTLRDLEVLVLDEADHMFDMGFLPDVRKIVEKVPADAQRLLFSATMPDDLRRLADRMLRDPLAVEIGRRSPAATVEHALVPVEKQRKTELLMHILRSTDTRSALVFTRTKRGAKKLADELDRQNVFATSIQGNLSQNKRQRALDAFRSGDVHVLVATDIAARGIDVAGVQHVINYDVPDTAEAYTHRLGRTGRAERTGEALTFVTPDDGKALGVIERALPGPIPRRPVEGFGRDVVLSTPGGRSSSRGRGGSRAGGKPNSQGRRGGRRRGNRGGQPRGDRRNAPTSDRNG